MRTQNLILRILSSAVLVGLTILPVAAAPETAGASDSEDPDKLNARIEEALARRDYASALGAAERVNDQIEPQHVEALYRIARIHALAGHAKEAYEWLERAHAAGYLSVHELRKDEAFSFLRDQDRFRSLSRAIWAKAYIAMLERPERDSFQKPDQIMAALAFRPGERVADVGAGSGYFTWRVAKAVGTGGVVWAVDVSQEMLDYLAARLEEAGIGNVRLSKVTPEDPQLPAGGVDTVLMVDTLHYVKERGAYAKKLRAALAPGGRVVIIDYIPKPWDERPWGPPPEQHMSRQEVDAAMAEAGLAPAKVYEFLPEQFFVEYRARE